MGSCSSCMFKTGYALYAETCLGRCLHTSYINRYKKQNGSSTNHSKVTTFVFGDLLIQPIPVLLNNYTYMVVDLARSNYVLVDVGDPELILKNSGDNIIHPSAILTTHKHWDHSHGNRKMRSTFKGLPVYGGSRDHVPNATVKVQDGDVFRFGRLVFKAIWTPGHTKGHTCYHLDASDLRGPDCVFTGDHLMLAGCGAHFEGKVSTMIDSLERLKSLPDDTLVWPGHEMGLENLHMAVYLDPENQVAMDKFVWAVYRRHLNMCTCPSTIGEEKVYNPYLRTRDEQFLKTLGLDKVIDTWKKPVDLKRVGELCYEEIISRVCDNSEESKERKREIMSCALSQYMNTPYYDTDVDLLTCVPSTTLIGQETRHVSRLTIQPSETDAVKPVKITSRKSTSL